MHIRRILIRTGLLTLILLTVSCVFLRLYKVQNQFRDFDKNFELNDVKGLTLVFLDPVLKSSDMVWLMKGSPSSTKAEEVGEVWTYVLEKQYLSTDDEGDEFDIPIIMVIQEEKLKEVTFPKRFLKNLSIPLLKRMFESMGSADINKLDKSASSEFIGDSPDEIPKMENIIETLGKPYSIEESKENLHYTYLYYLENVGPDSGPGDFEFRTEFDFGNDDKALKKAKATIRGLSMSFDFSSN